jgi:zona occludens toxin (predicted ATPase)
MHKHKDLGFPNRYVVNIYTGSRVHKSNLAQDPIQGEYRPEIYNLYKSHSQSKAVRVNEVDADKRGSVFQSWRFRLLLPLAVVMVLASFWFMWRFFHPAPKASQSSESGDVRGADVRPEAPDVQSERPKQALENLRVIGSFTTSTDRVFLVVDELGRVRKMVNPVFAEVSQYQTRVMLPNGEYASTWFSGPEARASEDKGGRDVARAR